MQLRPYQRNSLEAVRNRYAAGVHRQLITMLTGAGKTVVFANLPTVIKQSLPGQILVIAHREELLDQAAAKSRASGVNDAKEFHKSTWGSVWPLDSDRTVASPRTQAPARILGLPLLLWAGCDGAQR